MKRKDCTLMIMGGSGMNGAKAVEEIVKRGMFKEIIITYFTGKSKAEELSNKLGNQGVKISTRYLDAKDEGSLIEAFKSIDIVMNFVGPYYKFGMNIIRAAIESKVNYIDICDDCQIFEKVFNLDQYAKKSKVSIICGSGTSPGVTNLIAMHGAKKMERVDDINISFFGVPELPFAPSVFEHYIDAFEGEVPLWRNGQLVKISPFAETSTVHAPYFSPRKIDTYLTAHPQPITLPRYIKGIKNVTVRGGYIPSMFMDNIIFALNAGMTTDELVCIKEKMVSPREFICEYMASKLYTDKLKEAVEKEGLEEKDIGSRLRIELKGQKDKKNVRYTYDTFSKNRETTYLTPVIVAEMLAAGDIKTKGVTAVEGVEEPERILCKLFNEGFSFKQELMETTML